MKHYRLAIMAVLLTLVGRTFADNLSVANVELNAGETKDVTINLNSSEKKYVAFQFDVVLPEGISIAKKENGKLKISLNADRIDDHQLTVQDLGSNSYRLLCFSMTNAEFYGTSGALVNMTLQADASASAGTKQGQVKSQVFTETNGNQVKWDDMSFNISIAGSSGGSTEASSLTVSEIELKAGNTQDATINLNNGSKKYVAFQFDVVLPEGISIAKKDNGKFKISLNADRIDDHTLTVQDLGSNSYRLLCFSMTNAEFYGTSGALVNMTLQADASASAGTKQGQVKSQVFTETNGNQVKWDDISFNISIAAAAVVPEITAEDKNREYGEENPAFTYTTTATLTGEPSLTTTATKTSPVGEYDIVVERGTVQGDYTSKNGKLTITKAPLKITAKSYSIKQGDALPTFEATYEGFKNNETSSVLTTQPTIRTTATSASEPGTYEITISGASATNYDITYVKGTLTITAAEAVTVTAKSYSRKYGEANPTFEYTTSGATLTGTPSISCEATATSPVGDYDIVVSKGSITNYNVTLVNGKLTVTKAPLTITAKSYSIKQGDALPTFEATYDGFKNNETDAVLTKKPTITTTATSASAPGTYEIVVADAGATNYDITYVKGTLTITKADEVVVTAKSYSRKYGEANPTFEYTTSGATLTGTPSISCEATATSPTATSPVGEYDIVVSKGSITNYNVTLVNGKLTVTKAPLTITAKSYTIKQGDALPTFEAEYSGFKNNETSSVLTTQPTIRTTATSASEPGTYEITISGASATNYDITYVKGTLTITAAEAVTVTAKSYSRASAVRQQQHHL